VAADVGAEDGTEDEAAIRAEDEVSIDDVAKAEDEADTVEAATRTEDEVSIDDVARAEDEAGAVEAREAPTTLSLKMRSASILYFTNLLTLTWLGQGSKCSSYSKNYPHNLQPRIRWHWRSYRCSRSE
jgi:hypothetical protein